MTRKHLAISCLAVAGQIAVGHAQDYRIPPLVFSNADSPARDVARAELEKESGQAIVVDAVSVAEHDLDGDGTAEILAYGLVPFYCRAEGCAPRIYRHEGEGWRNILADGVVATRGGAGQFLPVEPGRHGFKDLLVGSLMLSWDGAFYREDTGPTPTDLDEADFLVACRSSNGVAEMLAEDDIVDEADAFCACMADQFETAGLRQYDMDAAAHIYAAPGANMTVDAAFSARVADFELGCRIDLTVN